MITYKEVLEQMIQNGDELDDSISLKIKYNYSDDKDADPMEADEIDSDTDPLMIFISVDRGTPKDSSKSKN